MDLSFGAREEKAVHGVASHELSWGGGKFQAIPSASKIMATVFWNCEGSIIVDVLPRGPNVISDIYVETLKKRFWWVRPHKDVVKVLHHEKYEAIHKSASPRGHHKASVD
jgi:hypothetical protein